MGSLDYKENRFVFENNENEIVLMDCNDLISNDSRVPFQNGTGVPSASELIFELGIRHNALFGECGEQKDMLHYMFLDVLAVDFFSHNPAPLRVAEFGCNNGILSLHIASLLYHYDPDAVYICICDALGNESGNRWLDRISQTENAPSQISLLAGNFGQTNLEKDAFGLVFINGSIPMEEPKSVILEAVRIAGKDAKIICYSLGQPLLTAMFQMCFERRREYPLDNETLVLTACARDMWGYWKNIRD